MFVGQFHKINHTRYRITLQGLFYVNDRLTVQYPKWKQ